MSSFLNTANKFISSVVRQQSRKMSISLTDFDLEIISNAKKIIPDLDGDHHKGVHGRIGIIGGCEEYTGAPFFAGISALRTGADLVHIFCSKNAAIPIKSYSPDLIVHPVLDNPKAIDEIRKWTPRLHSVVIGPGLGQDPVVIENVTNLLKSDAFENLKVVIDADGLRLLPEIQSNPLLEGGILTPNGIEFKRIFPEEDDLETVKNYFKNLEAKLIIFRKGERDIIYDSSEEEIIYGSNFAGSGRRCGGQGDLLSGAIATFYHWALMKKDDISCGPAAISCQAAGLLIKLCNYEAFQEKGRGALAQDMIEQIPLVFKKYFEN